MALAAFFASMSQVLSYIISTLVELLLAPGRLLSWLVHRILTEIFLGLRFISAQCIRLFASLWHMLREDCYQIYRLLSWTFTFMYRIVQGVFSLMMYGISRVQHYFALWLRIPVAFSSMWRGLLLSVVGSYVSKILSFPSDLLEYTEGKSNILKLVIHLSGFTLFVVSSLMSWSLLYGITVLPWTVSQIQTLVLLGPTFIFCHKGIEWLVPYMSRRINRPDYLQYKDGVTLLLSSALSYGVHTYLIFSAPGAAWAFSLAYASGFAWHYLRNPLPGGVISKMLVSSILLGPVLGYVAVTLFRVVAAVLSVYLAFNLAVFRLFPFYFEAGLVLGAVATIGLATYAFFREVSLKTWAELSGLLLVLPMLSVFVCFTAPRALLFAYHNTWLLFMIIAGVGTSVLLLCVQWIDRLVTRNLKRQRLSPFRTFSLLTILYASVFFVLYGFCFTFPYMSGYFLWSVALAVYVGCLAMLTTVMIIEYVAKVLHAYAPDHADATGVRLFMGTGVFLGITGGLGLSIPVLSWIPMIISNVIMGSVVGLGGGLVVSVLGLVVLKQYFPRVCMRDLYQCMISGFTLVSAPYGIWYVSHLSLSSVSFTIVILKSIAFWKAGETLFNLIPKFYYQDVSITYTSSENPVEQVGSQHLCDSDMHSSSSVHHTPSALSEGVGNNNFALVNHTPSAPPLDEGGAYSHASAPPFEQNNYIPPSIPLVTATPLDGNHREVIDTRGSVDVTSDPDVFLDTLNPNFHDRNHRVIRRLYQNDEDENHGPGQSNL